MAPPRATVLVIDDELDIREMLALGLSLMGYEVLTADGGERALEIVSRHAVDLIVSDLKMPGMDGIEVIAALRRQAPEAVIVVATGYLSEETVAKCHALGAKECLRKPFTIRELEAVVTGALGANGSGR